MQAFATQQQQMQMGGGNPFANAGMGYQNPNHNKQMYS